MDSHKMEKTLKQDRDAINDVQKEMRGLSDALNMCRTNRKSGSSSGRSQYHRNY